MSKISPALLSIPAAAYLLGSIPFGLLLTRLFGGGDVRKSGSGNIGATNVARVAGTLPGILTLLFDVAKGAAAVWLAGRVSNESATWMMIAALATLLGHCFPIWLKFRGGKGVATAAGAFLVLCPAALLGSVILFLLVVFFWRYISLASISAADLYSLGAASRAAADRHFWRAGRGGDHHLQTRRQHPAAGARRRAKIFLRQKERRRVSRIAILGGGSWGTALAIVLARARRKHDISLWIRDPALAESVQRDRENFSYLPGHRLAPEISVTCEIHDAISGAQILVGAIPTAHARAVYSTAAKGASPRAAFVSAAKGLEPATHKIGRAHV